MRIYPKNPFAFTLPRLYTNRITFLSPRKQITPRIPVIPVNIGVSTRGDNTIQLDIPKRQLGPMINYLKSGKNRPLIVARENSHNFAPSAAPPHKHLRYGLLVSTTDYDSFDEQLCISFQVQSRCAWNSISRSSTGIFFGHVEENLGPKEKKTEAKLQDIRRKIISTTKNSPHFREMHRSIKAATTPKAFYERLVAHVGTLRISIDEFWMLMEQPTIFDFAALFSTLLGFSKERLSGQTNFQLDSTLQRLNGAPAAVTRAAVNISKSLDDPNAEPDEVKMTKARLQLLALIPWNKPRVKIDLAGLSSHLHHTHVGLRPVKKKLVDMMAARALQMNHFPEEPFHGKPICLVGNPGTGRTTLAQALADGLKWPFLRIDAGQKLTEDKLLGKPTSEDEADCGILVKKLVETKTPHLVVLFDGLEKLSSDHDAHEILARLIDPKQNQAITDRFLDAPVDFSRIIFLFATMDASEIPPFLFNRLEFVEVEPYQPEEKVRIAQKTLIPRAMRSVGLLPNSLIFTREMLENIIDEYTFEEGVADLEESILKVCRVAAANAYKTGRTLPQNVTPGLLRAALGPIAILRYPRIWQPEIGVVAGLVTAGNIGKLLRIESTVCPPSGETSVRVTGLTDAMFLESVQCARSCLLANYETILGFFTAKSRTSKTLPPASKTLLATEEMHFHYPQAAVPKSGTSAGLGSFLAIVSKVFGHTIKPNLAVTGEITLNGLVQAIGGVGEKMDGALRAGVKTVVFPKENESEVAHYLRRMARPRKSRFQKIGENEYALVSAKNTEVNLFSVVLVSNYQEALTAAF